MIQGTENALAESVKIRFFVADTGIKHAFSCFVGMALKDMIRYELM